MATPRPQFPGRQSGTQSMRLGVVLQENASTLSQKLPELSYLTFSIILTIAYNMSLVTVKHLSYIDKFYL